MKVARSSDVTLNVEVLENQKKAIRARIKVGRASLTKEINHWDKSLAKYEGKKKKEGMLTASARSLVESSSKVSQETLLRLLSGVTGALEDLVLLCGNLEASDSSVLEKWMDELLEESDSCLLYTSPSPRD